MDNQVNQARRDHADQGLQLFTEFVVDGNGLPEVDFDVGESYAGQLPITDKEDEMNKLFFWFFPTPTKEFMDKKEIVIWLNGGVSFHSLVVGRSL